MPPVLKMPIPVPKIIIHNETNHFACFEADENTFHKIDILLILLIKTMDFKFLRLQKILLGEVYPHPVATMKWQGWFLPGNRVFRSHLDTS